jgi:hypothetical protein
LLTQAYKVFEKSFICIDGLDEFKDEEGSRLFQSLKQLLPKDSAIWLFLTGRPHMEPHVNTRLGTKGKSLFVTTYLEANTDDIAAYVYHEIEMDSSHVIMHDDFKDEIVAEIIRTSKGMLVFDVSQ